MKKWVRILLYSIVGVLFLLIGLMVFLQTSMAKRIIRDKVQAYVSKKTHSSLTIGTLNYSLPKWIELDNVLWRAPTNDTLLYSGKLLVDVNMIGLIRGKYAINKVELQNTYINLVRKEQDTAFNYQFIINAFAGKPSATPKKDTTPLALSVGSIQLGNVRAGMLDYREGSLLQFSVASLQLDMHELDLDKQVYDVKRLYANSLLFSMRITKEQPKATQPKQAITAKTMLLPAIAAGDIDLHNSSILFENVPEGMKSDNAIHLLQAQGITNKKDRNIFEGKLVKMDSSAILFQYASAKQAVTKKADTLQVQAPGNNLSFVIEEIDLQHNNIVYNNTAIPAQPKGLDYNHLNIANLVLHTNNNAYSNGKIQTDVRTFSFTDKSGFAVKALSGGFAMDTATITVKNLLLQTPNTTIRATATVYSNSFTSPAPAGKKQPDNDIVLNQAIIGRKDLDLLANALLQPYTTQLDEIGDVVVTANMHGSSEKMQIRYLLVKSSRPGVLNIQLGGEVRNVADKNKIQYNLHLDNVTASGALLSPFVNKPGEPATISLPPQIAIKGSVAGSMQQVQANINTNSAYGVAAIKAKLGHFTDVKHMQYDVLVNATHFETGKWIQKDSLLGPLTGVIAVKGNNGFDIKKNTMQANIDLQSFRLAQDTITNIHLQSQLNQGLVQAEASIKDPLIHLALNGEANIQGQYPSAKGSIDIKDANLMALGLSSDSLLVTTFTKIDIPNSTPSQLDALFRVDSTVIRRTGMTIQMDSAIAVAKVQHDSTLITVGSPFADLTMNSTVYYNQVGVLLQEVMNRFLPNDSTGRTTGADSVKGIINATVTIKPSEAYTNLVKGINVKDVVSIDAHINNRNTDSTVQVKANVPGLQMSSLNIANLKANLVGKDDSLHLVLTADTLQAGSILLYDALVKGGYVKDNMSVWISTKDESKKEQFRLSVAAHASANKAYIVKLNDDLVLNHDKWNVNPANTITLSNNGFNIRNFQINNKAQKIAVNNQDENPGSPLRVDVDDFKLTTITALMNQDTTQIDGLLNIGLDITDLKSSIPTANGIVEIDSVTYQGRYVADLFVQAKTENNAVAVSGKITGDSNHVDLSGSYNQDKVDVKVNLNPIAMSSIEPFTFGNLARSKGYIYGPININGAANDIKWDGELRFEKVQTTAAQFGTLVRIDGQKISFQYPTVSFNNFTVKDSAGNTLAVNGTVTQGSDKSFTSDLTIKAKNFMVVDNTDADNNMIYGKAKIDVDAAVQGPLTTPDVSGSINVKRGTDVTYVRQNVVASAKEREGLIEFVRMDTIGNLLKKRTLQEVAVLQKGNNAGYLNYNLNIDIDEEAKINVIVDPITRDKLVVQGSAQLNAAVNPNGSVSLTGVYNVKKGSYNFSYQVISRKFDIVPGSTVTLSGDPSQATVDITASYSTEADPVDLVGNELGTSASETNAYRGKVPFNVLLKIQGTVDKPQLSFDIQLPERPEGVNYNVITIVDNKLTQLRGDTSAMNKQVFALLILNRFIGDQSSDFFAGVTGGGSGSNSVLANSSVSGFLAEAVNQLAAGLLSGVDLDVNFKNIEESDPNYQHTDLSVALSKKFLNDRLSISVGKSFTVDGNDPNTNSNENVQFIPDITTTYKLSRSGKYLLKAYRTSEYEAILDGYYIETGVSFTVTMDYDKFKELLHKAKDQQEQKK